MREPSEPTDESCQLPQPQIVSNAATAPVLFRWQKQEHLGLPVPLSCRTRQRHHPGTRSTGAPQTAFLSFPSPNRTDKMMPAPAAVEQRYRRVASLPEHASDATSCTGNSRPLRLDAMQEFQKHGCKFSLSTAAERKKVTAGGFNSCYPRLCQHFANSEFDGFV